MASYAFGMEFARPVPVHALTPEARAAVETVRRLGREKRELPITTDVGRPRVEPYVGSVDTAGSRRLAKLAEERGFTVAVTRTDETVVVTGVHVTKRVGFTSSWRRGKASTGTWHEPLRFAMVEDERPVARQDQKALTSVKGGRPIGVDRYHLVIVARPGGIAVGVTEVEKRVRET